jgi:hypothetical protein
MLALVRFMCGCVGTEPTTLNGTTVSTIVDGCGGQGHMIPKGDMAIVKIGEMRFALVHPLTHTYEQLVRSLPASLLTGERIPHLTPKKPRLTPWIAMTGVRRKRVKR